MNLRTLFKNYLPLDIIHEKKDQMFRNLLDMLKKTDIAWEPIVDQLFYFLSPYSEENLSMA